MRSPAILISIILITAGITFPQGTLNPGTATDLQRLDMFGSTRIDQLMKSASAGNAESQLRLCLAYQNGVDAVSGEQVGRNLAEAAKWFRAAADQGNVNAQFKIGNVLLDGNGVRRNYAEAAMWFRKAAENKHAGAQAFLGKMYASGEGVPEDFKEAEQWFRKAAIQGDPDGQAGLAGLYYRGQGVPQDLKEALAWYRREALLT